MTTNIPEADELQRFNSMLDNIALGGDAPAATDLDPVIAEIAATLAMPNGVNLSRRRDQMRARVLGYRTIVRRQQMMRFAISAIVITLAAAATYALTILPQISPGGFQYDLTPTYGYSGDILGEFRGCMITDGYGDLGSRATIMAAGSPDPWDVTRTAHPDLTRTPGIVPDHYDDPILASEAAGFEVWVPQYIPGERTLVDITVDPTGMHGTALNYQNPPTNAIQQELNLFMINQSTRRVERADCEVAIGDAQLMHVSVRGQPAYWIHDMVSGIDLSTDQLYFGDVLMWEEAGFYFYLTADDISLGEAQAIAQSMIPASQIQP